MKIIVVSAVNIVEGGTLTILKQCLSFLSASYAQDPEYKVYALVYDRRRCEYPGIEYIEIRQAKKSWLFRVYYEYIYFWRISKQLKPYLWFSLHDMTPRVKAERRAVYCHNPTPFYRPALRELFFNYKIYLFSLFYKFLYRIYIRKNDFVVVQQDWIREAFAEMFRLDKKRIIVSYPKEGQASAPKEERKTELVEKKGETLFFYPSLPRPFKNFEVIGEAVSILSQRGLTPFKVCLTLDGTEGKYAAWIRKKYGHLAAIEFAGRLSRDAVEETYQEADCLLFPSRLETWGLPISEFAFYDKPMIVADLPYAYETASGAQWVSFFPPLKATELANRMEEIIRGKWQTFHPCPSKKLVPPFVTTWKELFINMIK